ncbi:MAG: SUMF1/EgtB/PvdO family nonheme iron enzyme, partial [Sneathiella sp.]
SRTRDGGWYDDEFPRTKSTLKSFEIMTNLVSNADYNLFVQKTGHPAPGMNKKTWDAYGLIHPFKEAVRFIWKGGVIPKGRERHPVVLVSWLDAKAYASWLSVETGENWHLPSELQWEKAARGTDGRYFPWGNNFDPQNLNSHDAGPFDTLPVGQFQLGKSPFGMLDGAGQVFEWTQNQSSKGRYIVKGGSWDDRGCGVCRAAARHSRPQTLKHILVGFRLVREMN